MERTVYHAHPVTGEFIGSSRAELNPMEEGALLVPAYAYRDAPPAAEIGFAVIRNGGQWKLVKDLRGVIYSTANGAALDHLDLGDLPEGFTQLPCPGPDHVWDGIAWILDEDMRRERLSQDERAWRNAQVESIKWLRERHRDEQDLQRDTTLAPPQFAGLLSYLQALRDWPQSEFFPEIEHRPIAPPWIAEQTQ